MHARLQARALLLQPALAIRTRHLDSGHPLVLSNLGSLALTLSHAGRYAEAESLERRVLAGYTELHPNGHPDVGWALHLLASLTSEMGRYAESESLHVAALDMRRRTLGPDHADTRSAALWQTPGGRHLVTRAARITNESGIVDEAKPREFVEWLDDPFGESRAAEVEAF